MSLKSGACSGDWPDVKHSFGPEGQRQDHLSVKCLLALECCLYIRLDFSILQVKLVDLELLFFFVFGSLLLKERFEHDVEIVFGGVRRDRKLNADFFGVSVLKLNDDLLVFQVFFFVGKGIRVVHDLDHCGVFFLFE